MHVRILWIQVVTNVLAGDMTMSNNVSLSVELLRSRVVGVLSVSERTSLEVVNLNFNLERCESLKVIVVLREDHNGGDHAVCSRDFSHDDTVTATSSVLLSVRQLLASAEVDKVGVITTEHGLDCYALNVGKARYIRFRIDLTSSNLSALTGLRRSLLDIVRVKLESVIVVTSVIVIAAVIVVSSVIVIVPVVIVVSVIVILVIVIVIIVPISLEVIELERTVSIRVL